MVFDKLRRKKEDPEFGKQLTYALAASEVGRTQPERELYQTLGINPFLIQDEPLSKLVRHLSMAVDPTDETKQFTIPRYLAAYILTTSLIRTSWISPSDAQLGILRSKRLLRRVKMGMSEEESESDMPLVIDGLFEIIVTAYLDAIGGRKAKLTKVSPRTMEIQYSQMKRKTGGFLP